MTESQSHGLEPLTSRLLALGVDVEQLGAELHDPHTGPDRRAAILHDLRVLYAALRQITPDAQ
jgi:hypothetical protein